VISSWFFLSTLNYDAWSNTHQICIFVINCFFQSSFVLSLHSPLAFCVGPNILLNIFLSNTNNFCLMFSAKTQHSDPYTTTGLIRAFGLILVFLDISLLWSIFWFAKEARFPAAIVSFISSSVRLFQGIWSYFFYFHSFYFYFHVFPISLRSWMPHVFCFVLIYC